MAYRSDLSGGCCMIPKIVSIENVRPASYNPCIIKEEQFQQLKKSINTYGMVLPLLVNSANNTIIAGHQRLKAAQAIGLNEVPVYYVKGLLPADEIKFNQIHNAIDLLDNPKGSGPIAQGWQVFDSDKFVVGEKQAAFVKEISKLLIRYGNVLSCVIADGNIVANTDYVFACQLLGFKVNCYGLTNVDSKTAAGVLNADYGEYSYNNIERKTYVQGLAQLYRSVDKRKDGNKRQASMLYEHFVLPYLKNHSDMSVLDFGAGKGAYIKRINGVGVEFYNNNGHGINIGAGNEQIDILIDHIKTKGQFDTVVCDSVLNSVDSKQAEQAVVGCCNVFCKVGGRLFISGRPIESLTNKYNSKKDRYNAKRFLEFLDADNFSANFRRGHWYFQHWHTQDQLKELLEQNNFKLVNLYWSKFGDSFQAECIKESELSLDNRRKAIDFEFDLPLPNAKRYNRNKEMIDTLSKYVW